MRSERRLLGGRALRGRSEISVRIIVRNSGGLGPSSGDDEIEKAIVPALDLREAVVGHGITRERYEDPETRHKES